MLKIGLLGCGRIGQVHARTLVHTPGAKLVALCDAVPEAAQSLAAEYNAEARFGLCGGFGLGGPSDCPGWGY